MFASLLLLSVNYYQCIAHDHLIFIISLKLDIYSPLCSSYARLSHIRINPTQFTCLRELLHTWYAGLYMRIPIRMSVRVHSLIFTHEEQSGAHQQLHTHTLRRRRRRRRQRLYDTRWCSGASFHGGILSYRPSPSWKCARQINIRGVSSSIPTVSLHIMPITQISDSEKKIYIRHTSIKYVGCK